MKKFFLPTKINQKILVQMMARELVKDKEIVTGLNYFLMTLIS